MVHYKLNSFRTILILVAEKEAVVSNVTFCVSLLLLSLIFGFHPFLMSVYVVMSLHTSLKAILFCTEFLIIQNKQTKHYFILQSSDMTHKHSIKPSEGWGCCR